MAETRKTPHAPGSDEFDKWANTPGLLTIADSNFLQEIPGLEKLLDPHGLKVVIWDMGSTDVWYSIVSKEDRAA